MKRFMRSTHLRAASVFLSALAIGLGVQAAEPTEQSDAASAEAESSPDVGDADAEELLARARQMQIGIAQVADSLSNALREARQNKDVVREVCLDDKLNQADVAAETAQDRVSSMVAAIAVGDVATVKRDFVVISALSDGAQDLAASGDRCLGEEQASNLGEPKPLQVTIDPAIPTQETTGPALPPPSFVLPPTATIQPPLPTSRVM
jgi:hypothetical protein